MVATSGCAYISRVSDSGSPTAPNATTANGSSGGGSLSTNGQFVAFESAASDIAPGDTNGATDVFVRDRSSGAVEAASVSSGGTYGSGPSIDARISPNGRFVVFVSGATNLVLGDSNGAADVFLRDRQAATTVRVSVGASAAQSVGGDSYRPAVSADGRYVAFSSDATNLVVGDTNARTDVFVRDLQAGTTTRVSVAGASTQVNDSSDIPTLSADGRYVAFQSEATNLVAGDTNSETDVFVRDRQAATTTRVGVATAGTQPTGGSTFDAEISGDGRYVVFSSDATNLVSGDTNATYDVFVRDRQTSTTTRVSVAGAATQANSVSSEPSISADGRYVSFSSDATNLGGPAGSVYRRDRTAGITVAVTKSTAGANANQSSGGSTVSGDGTVVAFASSATNLAASDHNNSSDVFARVVATNTTDTVSRHGASQGNARARDVSMSLDGRYVAFSSDASDLVPGDNNGATDVFVRDTLNGTVQLVSTVSGGWNSANGASSNPVISSTGRYVVFSSTATDLSGFDGNGAVNDVYIRDLDPGGGVRRVSGFDDGAPDGSAFLPSVSADGRYVAYVSDSTNIVPGDTNHATDVFVDDWTPTSESKTLVSVPSAGGLANDRSTSPSISPDGRYVVFSSLATNLVTGDTNGVSDVFLRDRTAGTTTRVSVSTAGVQGGSDSAQPKISADGRYVAFLSSATNLVTGDTNAAGDIFVRDRQSSTTTRVSVGAGAAQAAGVSTEPDISGDGRYIVFTSSAANLVPSDTNGKADVFVRDQVTNLTTRVSTSQQFAQGSDSSGQDSTTAFAPAITADGRYVGFNTVATNLVTPDANGATNDLMIRANPVPTITSPTISFSHGATGTMTVNGTYFLAGVSAAFGDGITLTATNLVNENQVKFTIKVAANAATGDRSVTVYNTGTGAGVLTGAAAQFTLRVT
jgi:Tol biopolymer transport system component